MYDSYIEKIKQPSARHDTVVNTWELKGKENQKGKKEENTVQKTKGKTTLIINNKKVLI